MKTVPEFTVARGPNGRVPVPIAMAGSIERPVLDDREASGQELFLEHLPAIQSLVTAAARQHRLSQEDAEAFRSSALVRLIDDDFALLRRFRGYHSWRAHLAVVIQRLCLEFRMAQWRNGACVQDGPRR